MRTLARLAVLTGLSLAVLTAARGDEPKAVELKPRWKPGEKWAYEMTRKQTREADGKVVRASGARTPVEVEVVAADAKGFVVRWKLGEATPDDPKLADNPLAKAVARLTDGMTVDLEIDADGDLVGVKNWKELQATGKKLQDAVMKEVENAKLPKAAADALRTESGKMFASRETVEAAFTRQPALLVMPLGRTYDAAKPATADVTLANPFGGDPIPATAAFALKKYDPATGLATVTVTQKPDPKELKKVLEKTLKELAKKSGQNPDDVKLPAFDMTDEAEFVVDAKTGWVQSATHTRRTKTGTSVSTETMTLTRREPKK
jgi:hypothetical protein